MLIEIVNAPSIKMLNECVLSTKTLNPFCGNAGHNPSVMFLSTYCKVEKTDADKG
jgi:hypothetical protein